MTAEEIKPFLKETFEYGYRLGDDISFEQAWDDSIKNDYEKLLEEYAQQKQDKQELEILKQVKFGFDICSDHSTQCLGYRNLCNKIKKLELPTPPID